MSEIIPAILPRSAEELADKLALIPTEVSLVHIDIVDEKIFADLQANHEVHFMIPDPDAAVDKWVEAGAKRIIVHTLTEKLRSLRPRIEMGLAVEFDIPLANIYALLPEVDFVQLMSIAKIGEQGHPLEPGTFDRIKELKEKFPHMVVSVDGGINTTNYQKLIDTGVERLVVGSGFKELWKSLTKN